MVVVHQPLVLGAIVRIPIKDAQWIGLLLRSPRARDKPVEDPSEASEGRGEAQSLTELNH
jgi:hypothetical protein